MGEYSYQVEINPSWWHQQIVCTVLRDSCAAFLLRTFRSYFAYKLNILQVAFLLLEEDPDDPEHNWAEVFCGGALIDSQWIVSAGHCFIKEVALFL